MIKSLPGLALKSYRELACGMFAHKSNLQLQGENTLFSKHFGKYYQDFYRAWPGTKFQNDESYCSDMRGMVLFLFIKFWNYEFIS